MQNQNESSQEFDRKVQKIMDKHFRSKLSNKAFAFRTLALLALGFFLSGLIATLTTPYSSVSFMYMIPSFMGIFTIVNLFLTASWVVRRVNDLVVETEVWPYAFCAVVLSIIPFVGYLSLMALAVLPSNYFNQEKRNQIFSKFA